VEECENEFVATERVSAFEPFAFMPDSCPVLGTAPCCFTLLQDPPPEKSRVSSYVDTETKFQTKMFIIQMPVDGGQRI
jgi:hypothetical protein